MSKRKKTGSSSLSGFVVGLLAATVGIAGVLYMLNRNSDKDFKEPQMAAPQTPTTEILTPTASEVVIIDGDGGYDASVLTDGEVPNQATDLEVENSSIETINESQTQSTVAETVEAIQRELAPLVQEKTKPRKESPAASKTAEPKQKTESYARKPTAEQILESGSVEKAREQAEREARRAEQALTQGNRSAAAKPQQSEKSTPAKAKTENSGSRVVQMGAYSQKESAEKQRAQLALLGVESKVVQAQSNGKTVYRVQSAAMSKEQASQLQRKLESNGVATQIRNN